MSRKLPILGQQTASASPPELVAFDPRAPLTIAAVPLIAVLGARRDLGVAPFANVLREAIAREGRNLAVTEDVATALTHETRLLVIVGLQVPRAQRDASVQLLWDRADLLLAEPSVIVATALSRAL